MGVVEDVQASAVWVAEALTSSGYRADFSQSSLWEIERFFDEQAPEGRARAAGLLGKDLGARLFAVGGYVGEVIRRGLGGEWQGDDQDQQAEINVALRLPAGTVIWPVQRTMKRFRNGPEDSVVAYGAALGLHFGPRLASRRRRRFWRSW